MAAPPASLQPGRFETALRLIDEANSGDPNLELAAGVEHPRELLYSRRLTGWVEQLCPDASEELRLAARAQHLCRWQIPRTAYPPTRAGYLRWREDLKKFHARKAGELLRQAGYGEEFVTRVQSLNLKQNFPQDPEGRVLEDALCLVFLQWQLGPLAAKTTDEKVVNALRKAWAKMTPQAHALARALQYSPHEGKLLEQALQ